MEKESLDDSYGQDKFNYSSLETADPLNRSKTGYSFASFPLGPADRARANIYMYDGLYLQGNFNATSKLTPNLGVRYELFIPRTDTNLTLSTFDQIPTRRPAPFRRTLVRGVGPGRNGRLRWPI